MKKSILYFLILTSGIFSCKNSDDSVFEESADARINAALAAYQKQLVESPYGWNAIIYADSGQGGTYGFYFKFDDKNRVTMYSDFSEASAKTSKESSYRLDALQTPVLIFDTYSYLHVLSDPDEEVNNGVRGEGLLSDFEFSIFPDSVKTDAITFVGRKNQSRLVLTKATQADAAAFTSGNMAKGVLFNNISKYLTYFKRVTLGGVTYELTVNPDERVMKLTWLEGSVGKTHTTKYYFSATGLNFVTPLTNGTQNISGFTNITWNANSVQVGLTANGSNGTVVSAIAPISIDVAAPKRWWDDPIESGSYWRSRDAFHVNGVDDAFGVKDLKLGDDEYYVWIYQPGITSSYDIFGPTFLVDDGLVLDYSYASRTPTFTRDGRAVFRAYGTSADPPVPTSGPAFEVQKLMYDTDGYYLIQTSATSYDMVSAKDAKSWITWF